MGDRVASEQAMAVAEAFGLGRPAGELMPVSFRSSQTWRLVTAEGTALVKHVAAEEWLDDFASAMEFERLALAAGISMARPIQPARPGNGAVGLGFAVTVDGIGWVRAYEWVEGQTLSDGDDVS